MGVRRLRALVLALPPDGAWARSGNGGDGWSLAEHLAATSLEVQHATLRALIASNSKRGTRLPQPLVVPRGNKPKPKSKGLTREGVRSVLMGEGA